MCGGGVGGVCNWRDGGRVRARQQEVGMGRGGVVSGERRVVGGDRMEGGSEGRGCGEWVRDGGTCMRPSATVYKSLSHECLRP